PFALAPVGGAAQPADDPLPRVAFEVKQEVADAVRLLARAPPDLLVVQALEAALDLGQVLAEQVKPRLREEGARDLAAHSESSGRRLCLALRSAGCARSSGLAREMGCPGGATGLRIEAKSERSSRPRERFLPFFFIGSLQRCGFSCRDAMRARAPCQRARVAPASMPILKAVRQQDRFRRPAGTVESS